MPRQKKNNKRFQRDNKRWVWVVFAALIGFSIASSYWGQRSQVVEISYSELLKRFESGAVSAIEVRTQDRSILGRYTDPATKKTVQFKSNYIETPALVQHLQDPRLKVKVNPEDSSWAWSLFLQAILPFLLIAVLWYFIFRQASGANNQAMTFGKSKATKYAAGDQPVTFQDVAGAGEAIVELKEIVDYLKNPAKYQAIGAKIPKGVLLMGPPGTGKTLLARAVAGEANAPFYSLSGSDFVEMFVGVGASRVRDLFAQAKKSQPCIIFLDEIDAVGRHRGAGLGGGHDEREQTLNQLLVEMDGFDDQNTVIILAATNRPDILDPALLRPGRFDRQVVVDKPDLPGRVDILRIHGRNKKLAQDVDFEVVARRTPGFTGADLSNLLNESALLSARKNRQTISMIEVEESIDRVLAGPERKSRLLTEQDKKIVAYHEVGHALVAVKCQHSDPVHKISILPRGMALGYTLQLPETDRVLISRHEIKDQIKILMGGRIAEDLVFGSITSGASNDIDRATDLARNYVCVYGMSERLGTRRYGKSQGAVFLGRDYSDHSKDYADDTARLIDDEIRSLIDECYQEATRILSDHRALLDTISMALIEQEVMDGTAFLAMVNPSDSADTDSSDTPGVATPDTLGLSPVGVSTDGSELSNPAT